jgi:hypothetical protein
MVDGKKFHAGIVKLQVQVGGLGWLTALAKLIGSF